MSAIPVNTVLVIGALGQVGSELLPALQLEHGADCVIASDVRRPSKPLEVPFELLDCTDTPQLHELVLRYKVKVIYHLAALLSANAERQPRAAWRLNMDGLTGVLEVARLHGCQLFVPSSIAAFGPTTPRDQTPQQTIQRPNTMYGLTKVSGELLCDYYAQRYGMDVRGLRYPGLISSSAPPGGGTTDYAVDIFHAALEHDQYTCFLEAQTFLPMMYMPDAIRATLELMRADPAGLRNANAYNVQAMSFSPAQLASAIQSHLPSFKMQYQVDSVRQGIAESWPHSMDDSAARDEWGWQPHYDLAGMTSEMLERLRPQNPGFLAVHKGTHGT